MVPLLECGETVIPYTIPSFSVLTVHLSFNVLFLMILGLQQLRLWMAS